MTENFRQNRKKLTRWTCWSLGPRSKSRCFLPCWICVFGFFMKNWKSALSPDFLCWVFTIIWEADFSFQLSSATTGSQLKVPKLEILVCLYPHDAMARASEASRKHDRKGAYKIRSRTRNLQFFKKKPKLKSKWEETARFASRPQRSACPPSKF